MIVIRLARGGRKKRPIYTLVAADKRSPRDGKFIEKLGKYDPQNTESPLSNVQSDSIEQWVKNGAQLSTTVKTLLKNHQSSAS